MVSALILVVPEAEPLVGKWRTLYDPVAREGVPPHVTVLFPFKAFGEIDAEDRRALGEVFAGEAAFDVAFRSLGRFPDVVWLAPEPAEPVKRLTAALALRFPDYPLYGGAFAEVVPHLTVAQGEARVLEDVTRELERVLTAPVRSRVADCALYSNEGEGWHERLRFPLGA
jgi:2'-5' RNA ligase